MKTQANPGAATGRATQWHMFRVKAPQGNVNRKRTLASACDDRQSNNSLDTEPGEKNRLSRGLPATGACGATRKDGSGKEKRAPFGRASRPVPGGPGIGRR